MYKLIFSFFSFITFSFATPPFEVRATAVKSSENECTVEAFIEQTTDENSSLIANPKLIVQKGNPATLKVSDQDGNLLLVTFDYKENEVVSGSVLMEENQEVILNQNFDVVVSE